MVKCLPDSSPISIKLSTSPGTYQRVMKLKREKESFFGEYAVCSPWVKGEMRLQGAFGPWNLGSMRIGLRSCREV